MRLFAPIGYFVLALSFAAMTRAEETRLAPANLSGYSLAKDTLVYVGTYTSGKSTSKGIYVFRLQNDDVSQNTLLVPLGLAAASEDPAFLELDPKRRLLFAVNEVGTYEGKADGSVSSFAVDPETGKLKLLSRRSTMGAGPCHLVLDRTGRNLLIANYSAGSVAVIRVEADGRLGAVTSAIKHSGKSINPARQEAPHAHDVALDPANRFAFVCDLGLDKVMAYRFDAEAGKLTPADQPFAMVKPGAGPRHMAFRPDGKFAYVLNELDSTVTAFAYDAEAGKLSNLETVSSLPPHFDGRNSGAEIAVHPNGKFLYVSNRGHNSVVLFSIDGTKGTLNFVEDQNTGGKTPRHFGIQPSGKVLAVANQDSNTVLVSQIDLATGRLKSSGVLAEAPSPVCVVFLPPPSEVKR